VLGALGVYVKSWGIWLVVWAIRRKGEFDIELDSTAKTIRWIVVFVSFAIVGQLPGPGGQWALRLLFLNLGLAFLCWPNCAYRVLRIFGRGDVREDVDYHDYHFNG
jgi:hypothetical protein